MTFNVKKPYLLIIIAWLLVVFAMLYYVIKNDKSNTYRAEFSNKISRPRDLVVSDIQELGLTPFYIAGKGVHLFYRSQIIFKDSSRDIQRAGSVEGGDINYDMNLGPLSIAGSLDYNEQNRQLFFNSFDKIVKLAQKKRDNLNKYQLEAFDFYYLLIGYLHTALSFRKITLGNGDDYLKIVELLTDYSTFIFFNGDRYDDPDFVVFLWRHLLLKVNRYPCDIAQQIVNDLSVMSHLYKFNERESEGKLFKNISKNVAFYYLLRCRHPDKTLFPITFLNSDSSKLWLAGYLYESHDKDDGGQYLAVSKYYLKELAAKGFLLKYKEVLRDYLWVRIKNETSFFSGLILFFAWIKTFSISFIFMILSSIILFTNVFLRERNQLLILRGSLSNVFNHLLFNVRFLFHAVFQEIAKYIRGERTNKWIVLAVSLGVGALTFFINEAETDFLILLNS